MKVKTTRFGELECQESQLLIFPEGLVGFPEHHRYVLLDIEGQEPFRWLQSLEEPGLAFVILDPRLFKPDYEVPINAGELEALEIADPSRALVLTIVTVPPDNPLEMTANLLGPLLINPERGLARQLVLAGSGHPTRHRVLASSTPAEMQLAL